MQQPKISIEFLTEFLKEAIPEYEEMLVFIETNGGWISPPKKITEWINKLKIHDYPALYRGEESIMKALVLAFMPAEQIKALSKEIDALPESERAKFSEDLTKEFCSNMDIVLENSPDTPEKEQIAQKAFSELSADEQAKAVKSAQLMFAAFIAMFYNTMAIMVHGRKLTDLVQAAESGDDDAFCFAVQIDKRILTALPYFITRHEQAIHEGHTDFLAKLHRRISSPLLRSKIRHKTLWLTFAVLDEGGHLDGSLKHREILDLCDEIGIDGYKNRIEEVGYLSKRIREYRLFQTTNQRSRH